MRVLHPPPAGPGRPRRHGDRRKLSEAAADWPPADQTHIVDIDRYGMRRPGTARRLTSTANINEDAIWQRGDQIVAQPVGVEPALGQPLIKHSWPHSFASEATGPSS